MSGGLIFLTGMPATGKTYWGRRWAAQYGQDFYDLDEQIALQTGLSVSALFRLHGEAHFRRLETRMLQQLAESVPGNAIIATGGGTPCFDDNIALMRAAGCIVYLQTDNAVLVSRIAQQQAERPLFAGRDAATVVTALLVARKDFYEQATLILPTENISDTTFEQIKDQCTNRH